MAQQSSVHNRLLAALSADDYALLEPMLERIPLTFGSVLIAPNEPIRSVIFPESGVVSTIANTEEGKIEVGVIGRDGFVGVPVILGTDHVSHSYVVQTSGEGYRIETPSLRHAIAERPSIFRPLGLYTQALIVQVAETAYANATFDIETRLARWLLMMQDRTGEDELPITHEFLAAMLGVRRPGVTVASHVLEGTGAIRAKRGRIEIRDRAKLERLAKGTYRTAEREYERLIGEVRAPSL